ncbi:MAG: hypothetical protein HC895_08170 [Leptolyngbyaceae cyanobacterium SM1_3_5]|nr:hypothetical protein [Leptolyngbyaceae cyanobacterium SM1_3_5]
MAVNLLARSKPQDLPISIDFQAIKAVIFDVDGTLYDLKKMYARVRCDVAKYYLRHPKDWQEIQVITRFIHERENRVDQIVDDLEAAQYEWVAAATGFRSKKFAQWSIDGSVKFR